MALLLELPCAQIELAVRRGAAGCLSRNVLESGRELYPGAYLLADLDPSFDPRVKGHPAYTVENVAQVLRSVEAPPTVSPKGLSGFDLFTGYLVFDALVLNRDRHAANWAVLRRRDGSEPDHLCPLYDNASSFGMAQAASTMARRLESRGVDAYVAREGAARPFARPRGVPPPRSSTWRGRRSPCALRPRRRTGWQRCSRYTSPTCERWWKGSRVCQRSCVRSP